jgi:hypothetical protein
MPSPALTLWIDMTSGKLLSGWQSISYAQNPTFKQGDSIGVELHIVKNFSGGSFAEYEFSPSTAVTLAIGKIDEPPLSGTFKLNYGTDATAILNYNATAAQVQTALNALASITAEGGVTVSKTTNSFRIVWNTAGTTANNLSYSFNELYPTSSIGINKIKDGSIILGQRQIYQVHIKQSPVANITSFVNQDAPVVTISQIHTPSFTGDTKVWRISISPQPKAGSFLIGFNNGSQEYTTDAIDIDSSADTVRSILTSTFNANWSVVKSGTNQWDIATSLTSIFNIVVSNAGIIAFDSKYGVLNLNTVEVEDLLAGDAEADAVMEIQLENNGTKTTITQQEVKILNDLIDDNSYTITQWGELIPADSVVRYDTSQSLSPSEKAQARLNIGVSEIDTTALTNKDIELEGRIGDLEGDSLTQNQLNAIIGSTLPSSTNVFITESSLNDELSEKANISHSHQIIEITGLSSSLTSKAELVHTHIISDIQGLNTVLAEKGTLSEIQTLLLTKSNIDHTHTSFDEVEFYGDVTFGGNVDIDASQILTASTINASNLDSTTINTESLTINDGTTSLPFGGQSSVQNIGAPIDPSTIPVGGPYPYEIPIKIDGIIYMVPAKIFTPTP